jgi:hypothetical protein
MIPIDFITEVIITTLPKTTFPLSSISMVPTRIIINPEIPLTKSIIPYLKKELNSFFIHSGSWLLEKKG